MDDKCIYGDLRMKYDYMNGDLRAKYIYMNGDLRYTLSRGGIKHEQIDF